MRYAGIDIASEIHTMAVVDEACEVLVKATAFREDRGEKEIVKTLYPDQETFIHEEQRRFQLLVQHLQARGQRVGEPLLFPAADLQNRVAGRE